MEPPPDLEAAGELNGSESGWTTYIGSPIYNDDEQSVDMAQYGNNYKKNHGNDDDDEKGRDKDASDNKDTEDEESDDSMASDASSGPSYLQLLCINSEGSPGLDYEHNTEDGHDKILSAKKASKQIRTTRHEKMVEKEEDDSLIVAESASSHV